MSSSRASSRRASGGVPWARVLLAVVLLLLTGCSASTDGGPAVVPSPAAVAGSSTSAAGGGGSTTAGSPAQPASSPSAPAPGSAAPPAAGHTADTTAAPAADPSLPTGVTDVPVAEPTEVRIQRGTTTVLDARFSGLARYDTSDSCEVPGQPCYDAPTFDRVARIDLGAPPTVPGKDTTFITGHSNRYHPDDPAKGVFSRLQNVRVGDRVVLTTARGVFVYAVSAALTVPFDKLTTTDAVVRVRPDTVVAISCEIAPDGGSYLGNYVVVGQLQGSAVR